MGLFKHDRQSADVVEDDVQPRDGAGPEPELEILSRERIQLLRERDELVGERDRLRSKLNAAVEDCRQLEAELACHRAHAERTRKLMAQAADYAAWLRTSARRDAELALRKARARADEIVADAAHDRGRAERDLLRLHALASETRAKLEGLTRDALSLLAPPDELGDARESEPAPEDLEEVLHRRLATSPEQPTPLPGTEGPEERQP